MANSKKIPSIDIMIPYYGDFKLLKKAVDSVLAQTNDNWNLTILDDHFPSKEAFEYYKKNSHPKIKYIRHKKNLGITENFNFAAKSATAMYCVIMGGDDMMLPNYVEVALKNIGKADFYQPGVEVVDADDKVCLPIVDMVKKILQPRKAGVYSGQKLATSLSNGHWLYFPSITWKTNKLKEYPFDPRYKILEDVDSQLSMISEGATLYLDKTKTFQYRRFADSLSSKEKVRGGVRFKEEDDVYDKFAIIFQEKGWKKAAIAAKIRLTSRIHKMISW